MYPSAANVYLLDHAAARPFCHRSAVLRSRSRSTYGISASASLLVDSYRAARSCIIEFEHRYTTLRYIRRAMLHGLDVIQRRLLLCQRFLRSAASISCDGSRRASVRTAVLQLRDLDQDVPGRFSLRRSRPHALRWSPNSRSKDSSLTLNVASSRVADGGSSSSFRAASVLKFQTIDGAQRTTGIRLRARLGSCTRVVVLRS